MRQSYDQIRAPSINQAVECEPEVYEFTTPVRSVKYRLVIVGKIGRPGFKEEPDVKLERLHGNDALGNQVWMPIASDMDDDDGLNMLVGLLMSLRTKKPNLSGV